MNKEEVYNQINHFKKELFPKLHQISVKQLEKFVFYVNDEDAKDKANFIEDLIKNELMTNNYNTILDLTFGSGNLTSHLILENNIKYKQLIFNDTNIENSNQNIINVMDDSIVKSLNILDISNFDTIDADLIILNPQISGGYEGDISKVNNYKSKLNKIIDYFFNKNTIIVFYGIENNFKDLFDDKKYIRYICQNNQLYIINKEFTENKCYEKIENIFVLNKDCVAREDMVEENLNISEFVDELNKIDLDTNIDGITYKESTVSSSKGKGSFKFSNEPKGNLEFLYKNILFKGVPGTGKSRAIDTIIKDNLELDKNDNNILRINIHSASSNSDLMQGIGISTSDNGNIKYSEKQGLILDIIKRATFHPNQPFVLILEEIQENSLNELIGDLIYLIEDDKRTQLIANNKTYESYEKLVDEWIENNKDIDNIKIPYLVNDSTNYKKMIMPNNLFIFCTSNYRDDKKIIEDNLLRRFEVIEIYPSDIVVNDYIKDFFTSLNDSILVIMTDEIHPDRFMIGHAIWKDVKDEDTFYKSFSKLITEFKDIREIEFDTFKDIIKETKIPDYVSFNIEDSQNYYELIQYVQEKIKYGFIS